MDLFIDTNIYLSFYHLTNEGLDELEKVFVLQKYGKLSLWLPQQVENEFSRNREVKIADALKRFKEEKLNNQIPQMVKGYPEYSALTDAVKNFNSAKDTILEKLKADIADRTLAADKIIEEIFKKANRIEHSKELMDLAQSRSTRGNPPGKPDSIGDALNWESLLSTVPDKHDLHVISDDGDFFSPLDEDQLASFLVTEWSSRKESSVLGYRRLSQFLSVNYTDAKLAVELEKDLLIKGLAASSNFARTHTLIEALSKQSSFTPKQASDIADAYIVNSQVYWIASDPDVQGFGQTILKEFEDKFDPDQYKAFQDILGIGDA